AESVLATHCFAVSEVTLPLARLKVKSLLWVTLFTASWTVRVLPVFVIGTLLRSVTAFSLIVKHTFPLAGLICSFDALVICAAAVLPESVLAVRLDEYPFAGGAVALAAVYTKTLARTEASTTFAFIGNPSSGDVHLGPYHGVFRTVNGKRAR